jgi:hypothetical protein
MVITGQCGPGWSVQGYCYQQNPLVGSGVDRASHYFCYIQYMPNIGNNVLTKPDQVFIEDVTRLLMPWGVPQAAARLYGYLLLRATPASLDQITADLEISKSSASVAARLLEMYTLVRRHGERGSKRALYTVSDNYEGILNEQNRMLSAMGDLLRTGARIAEPGLAQRRLKVMAEFYQVVFDAMETALENWRLRESR